MARKTGDIVYIKSNLRKTKKSIFVLEEMKSFANSVAQIKSRTYDVKSRQYTYQIDIDGGKYNWCDSFFQTKFERKLNKLLNFKL